MDSLRSLLVQNQTNLDRLRSRTQYFTVLLSHNPADFHKQYGPYADFWDEWYKETQLMLADVRADTEATSGFVAELRTFISHDEQPGKRRTSKVYQHRLNEMNDLAKEALLCQKDMLHMADERIAEHKEYTKRLLFAEALEGLSED